MHIAFFIVLTLLAFLGPFLLFVLGAVFYAFWQRGYALIILAMFVDAQFGSGHTVVPYLYTLTVGSLVCIAELVKPHLTFYES